MSGYRQEMHEESWEVLSSASVGDLTVEELRYAGEGLFSEEARRSIVVHDGEIQVLFMSSAMRYARRAAEACMARPAR